MLGVMTGIHDRIQIELDARQSARRGATPGSDTDFNNETGLGFLCADINVDNESGLAARRPLSLYGVRVRLPNWNGRVAEVDLTLERGPVSVAGPPRLFCPVSLCAADAAAGMPLPFATVLAVMTAATPHADTCNQTDDRVSRAAPVAAMCWPVTVEHAIRDSPAQPRRCRAGRNSPMPSIVPHALPDVLHILLRRSPGSLPALRVASLASRDASAPSRRASDRNGRAPTTASLAVHDVPSRLHMRWASRNKPAARMSRRADELALAYQAEMDRLRSSSQPMPASWRTRASRFHEPEAQRAGGMQDLPPVLTGTQAGYLAVLALPRRTIQSMGTADLVLVPKRRLTGEARWQDGL